MHLAYPIRSSDKETQNVADNRWCSSIQPLDGQCLRSTTMSRKSNSFRPNLEGLEDRLVPATLLPTQSSLTNFGPGTITIGQEIKLVAAVKSDDAISKEMVLIEDASNGMALV